MSTLKSAIVLIPGAWHVPEHFALLRQQLEARSYLVICQKLPSINCTNPKDHTAQTDADSIRETMLQPLLDEGKDVVVVMHSYGGQPGSAASCGLSESERASKGLKGGIVALIYMAAFVVPSGSSCVAQNPPPLIGRDVTESGQCTIDPTGALHNFYNDSPPTSASRYASILKPISVSALTGSVRATAHEEDAFKGRMGYIHCTKDNAIDLDLQQRMVLRAGVERIETLETDHSPFLTMPERAAAIVEEMVAEFEEVSVQD